MHPHANLLDTIGGMFFGLIAPLLVALYTLLFWLAKQMETKKFRWLIGSAEVLLAAVAAFHLTHHYLLLGNLELFCLLMLAIRMQVRIGQYLEKVVCQETGAEKAPQAYGGLVFWSPLLLLALYLLGKG